MLTLFASVNLSNPSYDKATITNKLFYFIYPFLWIYPRGKMNGHLIHYLVKKEKTDELPY